MAGIIVRGLVALAYGCATLWILVDLVRLRKVFAEFPPGRVAVPLLAGSVLIASAGYLAFLAWLMPVAWYHPLPWFSLAFVPALLSARRLSNRYEVQGTSKTEALEDLCSRVFWFGVAGLAGAGVYLTFAWIAIRGAGEMPGS